MHYMLSAKQEVGCPAFINGLIHENFSEGGAEKPMLYSWHFAPPSQKLDPLPKELWLISKDKPYKFDFKTAFNGHIISDKFLSIMQKFNLDGWEISKLHITNQQGKPLLKGEYFFAKYNEDYWLKNAVDVKNSKIDFDKKGGIKKIWKLALSPINFPDIFLINEPSLLRIVFCSENFARAAESFSLKGVEFTSLPDIGKASRA